MKINIFKAGKQTSSTGHTKEFTNEDLDQLVESYNLGVHEAPIRIGHEDKGDKTPAWGWVKKVFREGANLFAEVEFVPQMKEFIKDGLYKKVSASFYHPNSPVNPSQGKWSLRHVAVLGAEPPAVKGLKGFAYSEEEMVFDCSEEQSIDEAISKSIEENPELGPTLNEEETPMVKMKEKIDKEKEALEAAQPNEEEEEETTPTPEEFSEEAAQPKEKEEEIAPAPEEFSEETAPEEEVVVEAEFKEKEYGKKKASYEEMEEEEEEDEDEEMEEEEEDEEFSELRTQLEAAKLKILELQAEIRRGEISDFLEGIYDSGRLTEEIYPEERLLEYMQKIEGGYESFSEDESPLGPLMEILEKLPPAVCFTEIVREDESGDFSETEELEADPHSKALKIMESEGLEYTEALKKAVYG